MGYVDDAKAKSQFLKASLVILMITMVTTWVSFTTAPWGQVTVGGVTNGWGLWRYCSDNDFDPGCLQLAGWNLSWYRALQAFSIMAFICVNLCFLLVCLLIFKATCGDSKSPRIWAAILAFWAALCDIIAIAVFADKKGSDIDLTYGWFFALFASFKLIVVGVLMALEANLAGAKLTDI